MESMMTMSGERDSAAARAAWRSVSVGGRGLGHGGGQGRLEGRLRQEIEVAATDAQASGPQGELPRRLLPREVEHAAPGLGHRPRGLEEQGGLADARVAAQEDQGAGDEATAEDAVELGPAQGQAP